MKKIISLIFAGTLIFGSANAQILSEQNVQINMELQPILQLSMEGPEMIDFSFTDISSYISGIQKNGATILKVSSSVTFDLWAVGYSNGFAASNYAMDPVATYGNGTSGDANIPMTALELHQYPQNPVLTSLGASAGNLVATGVQGAAATCDGDLMSANMDYSTPFSEPISTATDTTDAGTGNLSNNQIYIVPTGTNPYNSPNANSATAADKYIAGYRGTTSGCGVPAGTWLSSPFNTETTTGIVNEGGTALVGSASDGTFGNSDDNLATGYYFIMDYRIVPGLPARFLMGHPRRAVNLRSPSGAAVLGDFAAMPILSTTGDGWGAAGDGTANAARPGAYSMYVKYVVAEDQ
jgi:hypothetical protein